MIRRLVGVLLLLFGIFLAVGAAKGAWDREQWRGGAVEIQGLVLPPGAGDRSTPALAAAETVVRLGTLRAIYAAVDTGLATPPQAGQRVAVLIDPEQRDRAVLDHPMALWGDQIIAGGLGAVLALVGLGMVRSRSRQPAVAGTAATAIATVMRQVAARRTEAKPSPKQPPQQQTAASFRVTRPAGSGAVIQRMRDSPVTVQRVGEPAVTRIVERPSGVLPILAFAVVVLALVVYLVAAA